MFLINSHQFRKTAVEVTGTITGISSHYDSDGDLHHSVQVSYSYDGQNFDHVSLGFYSSSMYEGKDVALLVDPEDPAHMSSKSGSTLTCIVLLAMGGIFAAIGIISLIGSLAGSRRRKKLMRDPGYAPGDPIEVFVDPQDYGKYTVIADGPANPGIIDYT